MLGQNGYNIHFIINNVLLVNMLVHLLPIPNLMILGEQVLDFSRIVQRHYLHKYS